MPREKSERLPDAGDLVWLDFDPVKGGEQTGRRPALVLTSADYHKHQRLAIVCPITSNLAPWPTKVLLPDGLPIGGAVLVDQIRAVDRNERGLRFIAPAPRNVVSEVRDILRILIFGVA